MPIREEEIAIDTNVQQALMEKHHIDETAGVDAADTPPPGRKSANVSERLKSLASGELSEDVVQEIRRLLAERLSKGACHGQDEIATIRANLWSAMLLGLRPEDLNSQHKLVSNSLHGGTSDADHAQGLMHFPKEDQRVLAADIKRTRQAYAMFKRDDVMEVVSRVLERYCVGHSIRYKQGQNELVAPFVMLQDPPLPVPVLGLLFESFMSRFVSRWFVDDEIEALLVSYRVFRVLLYYLDPGLASKLDDADFVPELYATAWLITLFSRNLSLDLVMRLWDVYLAVNDPSLVFFLLAALLVRNRDAIMKVEQAHMMPEMIQGLTVEDKQDLEELIFQARQMLKKIPESFLRTVRSCCSDHGNIPLDTSRSLFCESVRCVSIEPKELLERMAGREAGPSQDEDQHGNGDSEEKCSGENATRGTGGSSPCPMRPGPVDTVALDIRSLHEYENSGVGHLGKSLRLDPCLLEMSEILEKWMQHFDGTRGTHVCLIDSVDPVTTFSSSSNLMRAGKGKSSTNGSGRSGDRSGREKTGSGMVEDPLWRRLLFGEGEGSASWDEEWVKVTEKSGGGGEAMPRGRVETEDSMSEGCGAAKAFAEKLHARGFPYVSILEGGMEALVDHLHEVNSPLEPTVINHRPEAYVAWRRRARALRDKRQAETGQAAAFTRAGKAYSWRKGKNGGGSSALQEEYSSLPPLPLDATAVTQRGVAGAEAADAGGGPPLVHPGRRPTAAAHEKVRFMDRLGLISLKGVTQGVGTVAHGVGAVAHGVTQGVTQGVGTVARTGARAVMGGAERLVSSAGGLSAPDEESEDERGVTIRGRRSEELEEGVSIWEVEDGLRDGSEGKESFLGSIKNSGRVVVSGVGSEYRSEPLQQGSRHSDDGLGVRTSARMKGSGEVGEASDPGSMPPNAYDEGQEKSEEMLLKALETAEANGHKAIAKAIRARLGFAQGRALRARLLDEKKARAVEPSIAAGKKEILESLADLA